MQRTAICLVAVLALLAGCSGGVGGGSDATQTPTPDVSPPETPALTPTPEPTPQPASDRSVASTSGSATTSLDRASVNETDILEGDMLRFNATVSNLNDTVANQSVTVQVGERVVLNTTVRLEPEATRDLHLLTLNTSVIDPGGKFVTVSTENDSELFRIDIRPQDELETFINDVRVRTRAFENGSVLDRDHVLIRFDADEDLTKYYYSDSFEPVPQAAAFEMATSEYAPEKVTVRILPFDATEGDIPYQTTFNKSLATKLHNGTVDPREFRDILHERATGEDLKHYAPEWTDRRGFTWAHERFTFFAGDRARRTYAEQLAEKMNNTGYDFYTVEDYGLYNDTVPVPDSTDELGPNSSISITFKSGSYNRIVDYRNFTAERFGVVGYELMTAYGNLTQNRTYGERPEFVRARFVWPDGTLRTVVHMPTYLAKEAADTHTVIESLVPLLLSDYTRVYDMRLD